ncbi:MAG: hypothetical protein AAF485_23895 [Chloroflexota bacterium]
MTFGFPAYFTDQIEHHKDRETAIESVKTALSTLSWPIEEELSTQIKAKTSVNMSSWGEQIVIDYSDNSLLRVTSKCALPTQCFDWGKNKRNVRSFLEEFA